MRRLAILLIALLIAGCTDLMAARRAQLQTLVGRSETDLIMAMGVPTRTYEAGGVKFLAYDDSRTEFVPGSPVYYGLGPYPGYYPGGFYAGGFPPQVINLSCSTTFAVSGGVVRSFMLRGNACG